MAGISDDLECMLKDLEGATLTIHKCKDIAKVLDSDCNIKPYVIRKLLELCMQDPKDDIIYAEATLSIVSTILRKIMAKEILCEPDLMMPSMLKIIHMMKAEIYSSKSETVKTLYFKILLSYPNEAFLNTKEEYFMEVIELLNLYIHHEMSINIRVQAINLLHKYLKVLPSSKRLKFVRNGIDIWFLKLIPNVMILSSTQNIEVETSVEALEILTDELLNVDYENNLHWQLILQNICTPQKYPAAMKSLLERGSPIWHRLWIIFIKLLKNQITKVVDKFGSPINSILPVTEAAFKMDTRVRCQTFQCWDALIDNFATETDESYINKRIKLLVIPLRSNNAKVEEIVIAKFKTWWRLMCRFHHKVYRFSDILLIPFLHFCFGKPVNNNKPVIVPGLLSNKTKEYCIEALVNLLGHYDCKGCVTLPKLNWKIITARCLSDNWEDLIYSLNVALKITVNSPKNLRRPFKCAWISFIMTICDLDEYRKNEGNIRKDFFIRLLSILDDSIQDCTNEILIDIAFNDLLFPLFNNNDKIKLLLMSKHEESSIIIKILKILMNPSLEKLYKGYGMEETVAKLKPFTDLIVEYDVDSLSVIDILLKESPKTYNFVVLWTCLTSSLCEKRYSDRQVLYKMLLWPLKHLDIFSNVQYSSCHWHNLYDFIDEKDFTANLYDNILIDLIHHLKDYEKINSTFLINVLFKLLKQKVTSEKDFQCEKKLHLLQLVVSKIHTLDDKLPIFMTMLGDTIQMISENLLSISNLKMATNTLIVIKSVLKLIVPEFKNHSMIDAKLLVQVEAMLKNLEKIIKHEGYASLKQTDATELIHCLAHFGKQEPLKPIILAIMQILLNGMDKKHSSCAEIKNVVESFKQDQNLTNVKDQGKFTTPNKVTPKRVKKREASIVNTVVENGEEFVVVKSNWEFNPKKLTDKQKEKFQRHREDIPALYQDLSQSQEEFKLSRWNADADTTTSNNSTSSELLNGGTNQEISSILKNMPNTEVVPKILNNILIENNDKGKTLESSIKKANTPKLALKDRVFRNVRTLIEKSNVQNSSQVEKINNNVAKTPTEMKQIPDTVNNSTLSDINLERPSRVKRKPKKYDNSEIFPLKIRRFFMENSDSPNNGVFDERGEDREPSTEQRNITKILNKSNSGSDNQENITENIKKNKNKYRNGNENKEDEHEDKNENTNENEIQPLNENKNENKNETPATQMPKEAVVSDAIHLHNINETREETQKENNDRICDSNVQKKGLLDNEFSKQHNDLSNTKEDNIIQKISEKKSRKTKSPKFLTAENVKGKKSLEFATEKRITRSESHSVSRQKPLSDNVNKLKTDKKNTFKIDKIKENVKTTENRSNELLSDSQIVSTSQNVTSSQDVIESSQDSTISVMSVMPTKNLNRIPVVKLQNINLKKVKVLEKKRLNVDNNTGNDTKSNCKAKDDSELSLNDAATEYTTKNLTENMDTESIVNIHSDEAKAISEVEHPPIVTSKCDNLHEVDTLLDMTHNNLQNVPLKAVTESEITINTPDEETQTFNSETLQDHAITSKSNINESMVLTQDDSSKSLSDSVVDVAKTVTESPSTLPSKDEQQRKLDFLNNTLEISPIKALSPLRDYKSPSPDSSSDYVVIKLASPVQSNGQPFGNGCSPEVFTEEKISPDKRDQSPPREAHVTNASPRSLSLKKNKPQVRAGGRAAQMLDLCVPVSVRLLENENSGKIEPEQQKRPSVISGSASNLRLLFNSTNESNERAVENRERANFLKFTRELPAVDSSPSVSILKRKLSEISVETTLSPASKRKRVSFHDPPVSTTVSVKKYLEPCDIRSPQNSALKRCDRQLNGYSKSKKRLDIAFNLEKAFTIAIESFNESNVTSSTTEDTELSSLEPTPLMEVVKNCELNDVDPICKELVDCKDPIDKIATDLSSSAMRHLLVKEFVGKIETVGDLAKMTELEVNRLCIKAPKVKVAKKVLTTYFRRVIYTKNKLADINRSTECKPILIPDKVQTDCVMNDNEIAEEPKESMFPLSASKENNDVSTVHATNDVDDNSGKSTISLLDTSNESMELHEQLNVPLQQCTANEIAPMTDGSVNEIHSLSVFVDMEMQTDFVSNENIEVQTDSPDIAMASTQTDKIATISSIVQTDETGSKSTEDMLTSLMDKPDFYERLAVQVDDSAKQTIADILPLNTLIDTVVQKMNQNESFALIKKLLNKHKSASIDGRDTQTALSFMRDVVCENFSSNDLIIFCSEVLKDISCKNI